jgi:hypothetical protein
MSNDGRVQWYVDDIHTQQIKIPGLARRTFFLVFNRWLLFFRRQAVWKGAAAFEQKDDTSHCGRIFPAAACLVDSGVGFWDFRVFPLQDRS